MKLIAALLAGVATGTAAIFLHHFLPPFGLAIAVLGTFVSTWSVGRVFGRRRYKAITALSWIAIFWRGASLGVGNEIFIQGDQLGNLFLISSFFVLILAVALPAN